MKKLLICGAVLSLSSCAAVGPGLSILDKVTSVSQPAAAVSDKVVLEGTRGLVLAHNAVQGAIAVVNPLVRARVLSAAQVDRYEQLINQAERLFSGAGTTLSVAERTAAMLNIANEMNAIAGR